MQPIAIFGGAFDPVHNGHLRAAWEAAEAFGAQVRLLPTHVPPHKPMSVATAAQRVRMLELALRGQSRLTLDTRELRREGASYTIDTLRELRAEVGPARPLILLIGADAFGGLPAWREWRALFALAHVAMLTRPGHSQTWSPELEAEIAPRRAHRAAESGQSPAGRVFSLPVTALGVSASALRDLLAAGREPRWLVPDALLEDPAILAPYRA